MRHRLRELSSDPNLAAPCRTTEHPSRHFASHRAEARVLASASPDAGSHPGSALSRLRREVSTVRDGLRSPRSWIEAVSRHADDRSCWHGTDAGRGCGMRYRVRELSSAPNLPPKVGRSGAGVAQLVERLPSKQHVAGSSPVSRSNPHCSAPWHLARISTRAAGRAPSKRAPCLARPVQVGLVVGRERGLNV